LCEIRKFSSISRFEHESQKKVLSLPSLGLDSGPRFSDLSFHSQPWIRVSNYRTIGYQTHKKLWVVQLCPFHMYSKSPPFASVSKVSQQGRTPLWSLWREGPRIITFSSKAKFLVPDWGIKSSLA
jgi:hypothetical protein